MFRKKSLITYSKTPNKSVKSLLRSWDAKMLRIFTPLTEALYLNVRIWTPPILQR